jgi:glycosyltransferase involved in cell wall biosynthesis
VKKKILVVTPLKNQDFTWVVEGELRERYDWTFINLGNMDNRSWRIVFDAFFLKQQKKYDLVISMDYYLTIGLAIKKYLFGGIDNHFSYGFNKSRDSFLERLWPVRLLLSRALRACDYFVVHSTAERKIFSDYFDLPADRFLFRHWGADLSSYTKEERLREKFSIFGDFICAIGRNNRDYELLFRAVKDLDVSVVVVAPDYAFAGLDVPGNVKLLSGLSMRDSLGLISASMVNVVPIKDATRGAGHMTIAFAMHMGRPQIITNVDTIHDYFTADQVIAVEHGSVLSMRDAIEYLSASASARKVLGDNSVLFADKWLSSAGVSRSLLGILKDWESGNKSSFLPVGFDVQDYC